MMTIHEEIENHMYGQDNWWQSSEAIFRNQPIVLHIRIFKGTQWVEKGAHKVGGDRW